MSKLALLQEELGAKGITVAKVGEAEVMAANGLRDIFIANEIVGETKLSRVKKLAETIDISFGLDSIAQADMVEKVFEGSKRANVLIEIEVGENRSGVIEEDDYIELLNYLKQCSNINLKEFFLTMVILIQPKILKHAKKYIWKLKEEPCDLQILQMKWDLN